VSFLRPEFLWALPLVAVPILIHLLNRRRFQRVEFGAMEFLRRALRRTRRRLLLEDLLLLLLRTFAVLFLILALARPGAEAGTVLAGRPARGEVVVLDASLSMDHRSGGSSAFERARGRAEKLLAGLDGERGDRAALIVAGLEAERRAFGDPAEVRAALEELDRPGAGGAALAAALEQALRSADSLGREGPQTVRVTVLTDLQASAWDLEGPEGEALLRVARAGHALALVDTGALRRENLAVLGVELEPRELQPGESVEVSVRVRRFGPPGEARPFRLSLLLDGAPAVTAEESLAGGEERVLSWPLEAAETGMRGVEARLENDALPGDDRRAAILEVRPPPEVVLAGVPAPLGEPPGVLEVLQEFLDLGPEGPVRLRFVAPERLDPASLAGAGVVVLADPGPLPPRAVEALAAHRRRGGGLVLALGPRTRSEVWESLAEGLGLEGLRVGGRIEVGEPWARLHLEDEEHPALVLFADPRWRPLLTEVPFQAFREVSLPAATEGGSAAGWRVPLRFVRPAAGGGSEDHGPALAEFEDEGGRAAVLAAAPLPAWNLLPQVPGGALPFLLELLRHLEPRSGHAREIAVGAPLEVELPSPPTELSVTDPEGRVLLGAEAGQELLPGGRVLLRAVPRARTPGLWTVNARLLDEEGQEFLLRERVAVLPPEAESDLAPLDPGRLREFLPPDASLETAGATPEEDGEAPAPARPRDLAPTLYLLVAAFLAAETLLAAWIDRQRG